MRCVQHAVVLIALSGCSSEDENQLFTMETNACQLTSTARVAGNDARWAGCRAQFSGSPYNVLTMQFLTPGTTGSFISPGPGWLTISVSGESAEYTSLAVDDSDGSVLPVSVDPHSVSVYYFDANARKVFARGSLQVGRNTVYTRLGTVVFSAVLDGVTLDVTNGAFGDEGQGAVPVPLSGMVTVAPVMGGGGGGGQSDCSGYTNTCSTCGTCQAACYCAAACVCHNAGDSSCEAQNRQSAQSLGTTCSY